VWGAFVSANRYVRITLYFSGVVVQSFDFRIGPIEDSGVDKETGEKPLAHERSIFREEARQHYIKNQEKVVFPRLLSTRLFTILWILALILMAIGITITFWPLIEQLGFG